MSKILINGNKILKGTIKISGSKNSAVALVPAAILSDGIITIDNIPRIVDIEVLSETLKYLGAKIEFNKNTMTIDSRKIVNKPIPEKIATKLRASYYFMSTLLGKFNHVEMYFPGGCQIGERPIDQTLKSFKALGATIEESNHKYKIHAKKLVGTTIILDKLSVGGTINAILASTKAIGTTTIINTAREPEITNLTTLLNNMGAKIQGAGTSRITITGVKTLGDAFIEVIPDRIEAGTYAIIGALTGENLKIENIIPMHIESLTSKLSEMGVDMQINANSLTISKTKNLIPITIKTLGYPGFATDLQQPITVLLTQANGKSILEETIYENRFQNIPYLNKMGANIEISENNRMIEVIGKSNLNSQTVKSTDLRAGISLVIAALIANGQTEITEIHHILRGYENIVEKLTNVGADVEIVE